MTPKQQLLTVMSLTALPPIDLAERIPLPPKRLVETLSDWPLRGKDRQALLEYTRHIVEVAQRVAVQRMKCSPELSQAPGALDYLREANEAYAQLFGGPPLGEREATR